MVVVDWFGCLDLSRVRTQWKRIASRIAIHTQAEKREAEVYLAQAKTIQELECWQREIERGSIYTHILSGW